MMPMLAPTNVTVKLEAAPALFDVGILGDVGFSDSLTVNSRRLSTPQSRLCTMMCVGRHWLY